jgi:hypothetical protein
MIEAGEVGAVFTVVDRASTVLKGIATQLRELDVAIGKSKEGLSAIASTRFTSLNDRLAGVIGSIKGVGDQAAIVAGKMASEFGRAGTSIEGAATKLTASLDATLAKISEATAASTAALGQARMGAAGAIPLMGGGGGRGGALRGRGHGGGAHWGRVGTHLPGGSHFSVPGNPVLAAAAAAGYGIYLESEFEDQAARMFLTGQIESSQGMTRDARFKQIRDTLQRISSATGYSPKEVGDAMLGVERQFGGLPLDKRVQIEETLAPYAASEARLKETSFKSAFETLVGLAHMTGVYDPAKLAPLARQFTYSSLISPSSIEQMQTAMSYSMPQLHSVLGMDPSSVMFLTAMAQTAGIKNTKSGTWLRSFFEGAEPKTGNSEGAKHHNDALRQMGLLGSDGLPNWRINGPNGKVDWDKSILKLSDAINAFIKATPVDQRLGILKQGFGERGGGFAGLMMMDEFLKQFAVLQDKMKNFKGGEESIEYLSKNSPIQKFRQTFADLQNVLMDIGSILLPPVNAALKVLDGELRMIKDGVDLVDRALQSLVSALSSIPAAISQIGAGISGALTHGGIASPMHKGPEGAPSGPFRPVPMLTTPQKSPAAYHPPSSGSQTIHLQTAVNLDGREIARASSTHLASLYTHPRQAPYSDPGMAYSGVDYGFSTG